MSENIKEALEYAVDLSRDAEPILIDDAGDEWYDANRYNMKPLESPVYLPKTMELSTLTGLVDYIKSGLNELNEQNLIVQVAGPRLVNVYAEDECMYKKRAHLVEVSAIGLIPNLTLDYYMDQETFNIELQSKYEDANDRNLLLEFTSKVKVESGSETTDNGVSQITTIKNGAASLTKAVVPNPVNLKPRRTFLEVEQPASLFVFRMNKQGELGLFEADGGAWRLEAIQNIANYLKEQLKDHENVTILA